MLPTNSTQLRTRGQSVAAIIAVFASITVASYYYLWVQQGDLGTSLVFETECPASPIASAPYRLPYTGIGIVDMIGCVMVTFFSTALAQGGPIRPYTIDLIGNLPAELLPFLLDCMSHYHERPLAGVGVPLLAGLVYALKGGGLVLPIYWLFSLISHSKQRSNGIPPLRPKRKYVQATIYGLEVGYILPALIMIQWGNPYTVAAWQIFPIYIAVVQSIFLIIYSRYGVLFPADMEDDGRVHDGSTHRLIQRAYISMAIAGVCSHFPLLFRILSSDNILSSAKENLVPYLYAYSYDSKEDIFREALPNEVRRFLQWDAIFIGISTWLAGVWSWAFRDAKTLFSICLLSGVGAFILGPGAVVAGAFIIKERLDENARNLAAVLDGSENRS